MSDFNHEFLEVANLESAFGPVDMTTAVNNGQWVSLEDYQKCVSVLFAAAGTSGDDPVISINQATDNAGAGSKGVSFTRVHQKAGTTLPGVDTIITQNAAASYTVTGTAAQKKIVAIEINSTDLDVSNAFTHVQVSVAKTNSSQLRSAFYVMLAARHPQSVPVSALT